MRKSTAAILATFALTVGFVLGQGWKAPEPPAKSPIPAEYLARDAVLFGPSGAVKQQMTVTRARIGERYYDYSETRESDTWRLEVGGAQITLWGHPVSP